MWSENSSARGYYDGPYPAPDLGPLPTAYLFQTLTQLGSSSRPLIGGVWVQVDGVIANPVHGYITIERSDNRGNENAVRSEYAQFSGSTGIGGFQEAAVATDTNSPLVLQAVIIPGASTNEGRLVEAVAPAWFEIIELLGRTPGAAQQIPSRKWEELIAGAYRRAGFEEVTLTPRSGDLGRDIIAVKRGLGIVRIIDQVKAYKPGHLVTADDVRALLGVLHADGASKGFLTTTSDFAPRLHDDALLRPFMPSRLELVNGTTLLRRLREIAARDS
jgi:restriction system protein